MDATELIHQFLESLSSLHSNKSYVVNGRKAGPGVGESKNLQQRTVLSKTKEEAHTQKLFEDAKLGRLGDISPEEYQSIVQKYAEELLRGIIGK